MATCYFTGSVAIKDVESYSPTLQENALMKQDLILITPSAEIRVNLAGVEGNSQCIQFLISSTAI